DHAALVADTVRRHFSCTPLFSNQQLLPSHFTEPIFSSLSTKGSPTRQCGQLLKVWAWIGKASTSNCSPGDSKPAWWKSPRRSPVMTRGVLSHASRYAS